MTSKAKDSTFEKVALVFGISGDQGQSVASGLIATGSYHQVYGATRDLTKDHVEAIAKHMSVPVKADEDIGENNIASGSVAKHVTIIEADLNNVACLRQTFHRTRATDIFLVTTTDVPTEGAAMGSFHESEELECASIKSFFDVLVEIHEGNNMEMERHVVFSTLDNVRGLVEWLQKHKSRASSSSAADDLSNMKPLDDGAMCPNYSGKARGGEYALSLIHGIADPWKTPPHTTTTSESLKSPWVNPAAPTQSIIPGLTVTLITLPFLHTNFALSAAPLPATNDGRTTQWSISACLGDPSHPLDMFSVSDLRYIVPTLFQQYKKYQGQTIKLSGEKITMDKVAYQFAELFGKDVVYSPLTLKEMSSLDIPEASAFAQMCRYLASPFADHDLEETKAIMSLCGKEPQTFQDWLLSHSDKDAFEKVGLTLDGEWQPFCLKKYDCFAANLIFFLNKPLASPIQCVTVFNATSMQGKSVIKGLLADTRKQYMIRACISGDVTQDDSQQSQAAKQLQSLEPDHIAIHYANLDDVDSCTRALQGSEGAFVVADFHHCHTQLPKDLEREQQEERHARVVIDACALSGSVNHLVLSTMEPADDVGNELKESVDSKPLLDIKARMAAYGRAKHISMTYVIMPVYSEHFFRALADKIRNGKESDYKKDSMDDESTDEKVVCMSTEELGIAVANIFDSYEVYAGHEIGLVADILTLEKATEIVEQVFFESPSSGLGPIQEGSDEKISKLHSDYRLDIVAKDLGQMFRCYSKTDYVKQRAILELVPDAKPFKGWLEANRDNTEFREMLGLR